MDSLTLTLIANALATGAVASSQVVASEGVQEAYQSLKTLIRQKFANEPDALLVLSKYEEKPTIWKAPLKDELTQVHADQDEEIVKTAQKLMNLVKPQQEVAYEFITANREQVKKDYVHGLDKARDWARLAQTSVVLGFFIILIGVLAVFTGHIAVAIVASITSIVPEVAAIFFFLQARDTNKQVDRHFEELLKVEDKKWDIELALTADSDVINKAMQLQKVMQVVNRADQRYDQEDYVNQVAVPDSIAINGQDLAGRVNHQSDKSAKQPGHQSNRDKIRETPLPSPSRQFSENIPKSPLSE